MLFALVALWQEPTVRVTAVVDRERLPVGDDVVFTLKAVTAAAGPFRVEIPTLAGLEVAERTERIDDVVGVRPAERAYQLELRLRAAEVGTWRFAPVIVFVGSQSEAAPVVTVTVTGSSSADPSQNARVIELIRQVPAPNPGANVTLAIVVSANQVFQGDQLDVLTAAWFPRGLRARLRRPPTLKPPVLSGVWGVPQPAIPGIVASRAVGDEVFDLFVSHQIAYPLTPGRLTIPPARLEYAVPMTRRASGDERPVEATSEPLVVAVMAAPSPPAGFRGPQGRAISLGYRIRSLPGYAGEILPVEITLAGDGNVTFWPPPNLTWPAGTRAYLDRVAEVGRVQDGRLGGLKTFHFLLLPDSVGSVALPALSYDFFDPGSGQYRTATAPGVVVPVLPARVVGPARLPPPLVAAEMDWPTFSTRFGPQGAWWLGLLVGPLLALVAWTGLRWRLARRPRRESLKGPDGVAALDVLVSRLVAEGDRGSHLGIEAGLRRAGLAASVAEEVAALKLASDWSRFAPESIAEDGHLAIQTKALLKKIPRLLRRRAGLVLLLVTIGSLAAQLEGSPEFEYRAKAYQAAKAGFRARAQAEPTQWAHWHNLAAASYLAGNDAEAAAALARARALAPRATPSGGLWGNLERQYEPLRAVPRSRLSRPEWALLAIGVWWLGLMVLAIPRFSRRLGLLTAGLGLLLVLVQAAREPWRPAGFLTHAVQLLKSPHGLAPENGSLGALTPVTFVDRRPGWILVVDRSGTRGWVPAVAVAAAP